MPLKAREPDFTRATILLGDSIAQQLIHSSRQSRERWSELFAPYCDEDIRGLMAFSETQNVAGHPLVDGFLASWAQNTVWGIQPPLYTDGVRLRVPTVHLDRLAASSNVESFSVILAVRAEFCSATMCTDESHGHVMLIVNCPAFLHIASRVDYQAGFERTLAGIIQHEMAHIRWRNAAARSETHAHCRGIASVLEPDTQLSSAKQLRELIEAEYLELAQNDEIRDLLLNGQQATWRLSRRWHCLFNATRAAEKGH
jgi:hypothetical protein